VNAATPLSGRVVRLGEDVNTDLLLAGEYLNLADPDELAAHLLERYEPPVADRIGPGTILLAGRAFGGGSSREQAVLALVARGVTALVAASFARIFFRNAVNLGLPAVECAGAWCDVRDGDEITIDLVSGTLARPQDGAVWSFAAPSPFVADLLAVGGLEEWTRKRLVAVRPAD